MRNNPITPFWYFYLGSIFTLALLGMLALLLLPNPLGSIIYSSLFALIFSLGLILALRSFVYLPARNKLAGELILIARPSKTLIYLVSIAGFLSLIIFLMNLYLILTLSANTSPFLITNTLFEALAVFVCLLIAFKKVEIREKGIFFEAHFVAWDNIDSFEWTGYASRTLSVKLKKPGLLTKSYTRTIREQDKAKIEHFLQGKLPLAGSESGKGSAIRL